MGLELIHPTNVTLFNPWGVLRFKGRNRDGLEPSLTHSRTVLLDVWLPQLRTLSHSQRLPVFALGWPWRHR